MTVTEEAQVKDATKDIQVDGVVKEPTLVRFIDSTAKEKVVMLLNPGDPVQKLQVVRASLEDPTRPVFVNKDLPREDLIASLGLLTKSCAFEQAPAKSWWDAPWVPPVSAAGASVITALLMWLALRPRAKKA